MATRKKSGTQILRGRVLTAALSLSLLAAAGMIGMYTVGKSEQKKEEEEWAKEQERKQTEAEALYLEEMEAAKEKEESPSEKVNSGNAVAKYEEKVHDGPELESDFIVKEESVTILPIEEVPEIEEEAVTEISYSFSPETDRLMWPIAGTILLNYSMDKTIYFPTLDQYKYNPAVVIQGQVGQDVICGADGKVDRIEKNDELGTMVYVDLGSGYEAVYGQLAEIAVEEGSLVQPGVKLGVVAEPTHYYTKEGPNVYFQIKKDGEPINPMDLLQ